MKRIFDIVSSMLGLILFSLPILFIILLVRSKLGTPVFFCQLRAGMHCRPFKMIKLRTMTDERGSDGQLLPDEVRLTPLGRFLRSTSLDELPELWNVLIGHMSLVGPRPLFLEYLPLYSSEQARRHDVRPGITGWAQINGRNALCWEDKFKLDIWYLENQGFWLDIKILWLTAKKVLDRDGINAPGEVTMHKFTGSKS